MIDRSAHQKWRQHVNACPACLVGDRCGTERALSRDAEAEDYAPVVARLLKRAEEVTVS